MKFLVRIIIPIFFYACNDKNLKYYWITFYNNKKADTIFITSILKDSFPSGATTYYYNARDTLHYFVRPDTLQGSQTNRFPKLDPTLRFFSDTILYTNQDTLYVYKFAQNELNKNEMKIHYWEKHIGIYAVQSFDLKTLTILQSNDSILNKKIDFLINRTIKNPELFLKK